MNNIENMKNIKSMKNWHNQNILFDRSKGLALGRIFLKSLLFLYIISWGTPSSILLLDRILLNLGGDASKSICEFLISLYYFYYSSGLFICARYLKIEGNFIESSIGFTLNELDIDLLFFGLSFFCCLLLLIIFL